MKSRMIASRAIPMASTLLRLRMDGSPKQIRKKSQRCLRCYKTPSRKRTPPRLRNRPFGN